MKAYLIDPVHAAITEITLDPAKDRLPQIYAHLGCDAIDAVTIPNAPDHTCYVDDEGLHKPLCHFIALRGYPHPIAGKGLVVRITESGDTAAATLSLDQLKRDVMYITLLNKTLASVAPASTPEYVRVLPLSVLLAGIGLEAEVAS